MRLDPTPIHKKQRKDLFSLVIKVGEAEFNDSAIITEIHNDLFSITKELREHAFNEETFMLPLLKRKMPRAERDLLEEHEHLKNDLLDLETNFTHLQMLTPHYEKIQAQGLEFYRMLNRFVASYLTHMDEEEYIMQNLWEIAADAESMGMMTAFITYDKKENGEEWLNTHLPGMSVSEQQLMFKTTQLMAPENIFITMCNAAEKIMGQEKWQLISSQLTLLGEHHES